MKTVVYFGSTTGDCERIAKSIASKLNADIHNVSELSDADMQAYDLIVLGSSTWGYGDLQDDWEGAISTLSSANLAGKKVAVFGCGDSASYSDTYCNAIGLIYDAASTTGATMVGGGLSTDSYEFSDSAAVRDNAFVGLALDEVNQPELTDSRIDAWVKTLL
ncbi:MAG: flavodoxin [Paludibacteraceae bacterium]|nr:flavodoxin [Paludibacteraceae bacterium]